METKRTRSEQARINGAKSRGPVTDAGKQNSRAANLKHGLYARHNQTLPTESDEAFVALRAEVRDYWQPASPYEDGRVERLVRYLWELRRLDDARHQQYLDAMTTVRRHAGPETSVVGIHTQTVTNSTVPCGAFAHIDAKIRYFNREISYLERDLIRNKKHIQRSGSSQMSLIKKVIPMPEPSPEPAAEPVLPPLPPEPEKTPQDILAWAKESVDFHPDPHQADLMTTAAKTVMLLGARQSGKSTAAAVRVVYEAVHNANATILLAGPTGRQSGQIMEKARQLARKLNLTLAGAPPGCDGFQLPNGSRVISLPDSESTIRGFSAPRLIVVDEAAFASGELFKALKPMLAVSNGAMLLLSTPNGQSGYFYELWHDKKASVHRIFLPAADCPRISADALRDIKNSMFAEDFAQEFECKFITPPRQFIPRDIIDQAFRNLPEY